MTTPNQPAPDGAYIVGGDNGLGDGFNFGQDMTDAIAKSLYMPVVSFVDQLGALAANLLKMPLEVLKQFMPAIPGASDGMFKDVPTAVQTIINWFTGLGKLLLVGDFLGFLRQVTGGASDNMGELVQEFISMLNPLNSIPYIMSVLNQILDIISGAFTTPINGALQMLKDWWNAIAGKTQSLTEDGEFDATKLVGTVAATAVEGLVDLGDTVVDIGNDLVATGQAIVNGWFGGSSATGTPTEVQETIETIKQAVINGYTVDTITSSSSYDKPSPTISELVVIGVGGGRPGAAGTNGTIAASGGTGGAGGNTGGYLVQQFDPADITWPVSVTIGTSNNNSSFGPYLTTAPGAGGIATSFGYAYTASNPGSGGMGGAGAYSPGGTVNGVNGVAGNGSAAAAGGAYGAGARPGGAGTAGGAVSAGATVKCGGAGGGGGGGGGNAGGTAYVGGVGGAGGYPGGGGGGGGGGGANGSFAANGAAGGAGATGVLWVFWKA